MTTPPVHLALTPNLGAAVARALAWATRAPPSATPPGHTQQPWLARRPPPRRR